MDTLNEHERWEYKIGVPVEAVDDSIGYLRQVILNPGNNQVSALVVRRQNLPARDYVIPVKAVEYANDEGIRLKITRDEVVTYPLLHRERYLTPAIDLNAYSKEQVLFSLQGGPRGSEQLAQGVTGDSAILIRAGQQVEATDGEVGKVDRVLVDSATNRATHFTVRKGLLFHRDIMVPVEWIAEGSPHLIKLGVDRSILEHFPIYRRDQELQWAVEDALWNDDLMLDEMLSLYPIAVSVQDGVVTLAGNVRNTECKQRAQKIVAGVPGVLRVENHIFTDNEIEEAVVKALADDLRTRNLTIQVYSWFGHVHLEGEVPDKEARLAAHEITDKVPGVRTTMNLLIVGGVPSFAEQQRLRELTTGQPVYAQDEAIGQVEKLLFDPQTWRISSIVVQTKPGKVQGNQSGSNQDPDAIIVPVEYVERVTVGEVYLTLTKKEAARLPWFDSAKYPSPDPKWQPPVPYRCEDIALDLDYAEVATSQPGSYSW